VQHKLQCVTRGRPIRGWLGVGGVYRSWF